MGSKRDFVIENFYKKGKPKKDAIKALIEELGVKKSYANTLVYRVYRGEFDKKEEEVKEEKKEKQKKESNKKPTPPKNSNNKRHQEEEKVEKEVKGGSEVNDEIDDDIDWEWE